MTTITRETNETRVRLTLGRGESAALGDTADPSAMGETADPHRTGHAAATVDTTDPFLDHMLATFARYSGLRLVVEAAGDLRHHLIEDVAITLGLALRRETPATCARYGTAIIPMDDALVQAALDVGGRFYYRGPLPSRLYDHFLRSLAENACMTLHVRVVRGMDRHHVIEAGMKAVGSALGQALKKEGSVFSTKGAVRINMEVDT